MAWILDVVFFVVLLLGCLIGAKIGLVKGVCKIAGWILSFVVPFVFCVAFKDALERWFGMVTAISEGIGNPTIGGWISIAIAFVALIAIVRLGTFLLGNVGTIIVDCVKPAAIINGLLGGILGLFEAFLAAYFLILICGWLPIDSVHVFIQESTVVRAIYESDLMAYLPF